METQTASRRSATHDVYDIVTSKIIEHLEKGIVPWQKPWTQAGIPRNIATQNPYRGINLLLLAMLGYARNFFITEKQLKEIGGAIKAGERPHMITHLNWDKSETGKKKAPTMSYYHVYNIEQCVLAPDIVSHELLQENITVPCDEVIENMPQKPVLKNKEGTAYYDLMEDYINLPKRSASGDAKYYSAYFHQLAHSTGHHTRLDRMGLAQMAECGYPGCSQEEVVAEFAACYLQSLTGIASTAEPNKEYVQVCVEKLKKEPMFIFTATMFAQKAVDFILNTEPVYEEAEEVAAS